MSYKIPMGPYHPALEEPYKLDLICEGETVRDAKLHIGFNFRGIEHLAETRNYIQVIALMERVCGICSNIHTLTLCQAMEQLTGLTPPPRAQYIRVVMAELERLHSHVLWAGIAAKLMGFKTMFMTCFELREKVMDVLQAISGNRVNYSMNRIGGVNRDIDDPLARAGHGRAAGARDGPHRHPDLHHQLHGALPLRRHRQSSPTRRPSPAASSGPRARASGVPQDLRRAAPYAAYSEMEFNVPVEQDGDVRARLLVRALEIMESCKILRQALTKLPPGELNAGEGKLVFSTGTATSRVEAPRGEVMYSVSWKEGSRNPSRVHVRTPTFAEHAGHPLDGDGRSPCRHALDPGIH